MTESGSRRNFLRGKFSARPAPLRPPWALAEAAFLTACTRCGDCLTACPTRIITGHDAGYPVIDFSVGECTFCGDCANACTTGALQKINAQLPWPVRAIIHDSCLALQRIECRVCGEMCAMSAICFPPKLGGIAAPVLDQASCTGCGACVAPCPSQSISVG
jgi:ferredoxin-type protein NapF